MVNGKDSCSKFRIPNGKLEDMNYIISLAKNEGWNSGIHDGLRTNGREKPREHAGARLE